MTDTPDLRALRSGAIRDPAEYWKGPWRVLVTGGRDYADDVRIAEVLGTLLPYGIEVLIHGDCGEAREDGTIIGADLLADVWARNHGVPFIAEPADWKQFGRAAGPIRNRQMLREHKPTMCVAFGGGRGTHDMITQCRAAGLRIVDAGPIPRDLRPRRAAPARERKELR